MNNLYVIFCIINIFAIYVNSASITAAADIYDVASKNFSISCFVLTNNVLVNSTSKYLENCKGLSLMNPPTKIELDNINKFYCIGILIADMQLCKSISNSEYKLLPQSLQELDTEIVKIQNKKPEELCISMKNFNLFNDETIIPIFENTIKVLKKELTGDRCVKFCSEYQNENTTNKICSMIYYIHWHINNVSKMIIQEKTILPTPRDSEKTLNTSKDSKILSQPTTSAVLQNGGTVINQEPVLNKLDVKVPQKQVNYSENTKPEAISDIQQNIPNTLIKDFKKSNNTEPKNDKHIILQAPAFENHLLVPEESSKTEAIPTVKDEPKSIQTKNNNDDDDTNKTQKEMKPLLEKITEPSVLTDDKIETTTIISTELNFMKQHVDNIDYEDDGDIDDTGKLNDDANTMPDNIQDGFLNNRADFNPNKQSVDVEEESNFFSYFMFFSVMFIAGYVVYHNKQKIMALILEGRKDRNSRRRPSTSSYRKLNSNLEEAVTSKCSGSASHVIY